MPEMHHSGFVVTVQNEYPPNLILYVLYTPRKDNTRSLSPKPFTSTRFFDNHCRVISVFIGSFNHFIPFIRPVTRPSLIHEFKLTGIYWVSMLYLSIPWLVPCLCLYCFRTMPICICI